MINLKSWNGWGLAGLTKLALDRFRVYATYIQMLMILKLYLNDEGWSWWYLVLLPAFLIVMVLDVVFMLRGEQQASFDVHPYFPEMRDNLRDLRKELQEVKLELHSLQRSTAQQPNDSVANRQISSLSSSQDVQSGA